MQTIGILQKWGSYERILEPGLQIINPISDNIIEINRQTRTIEFNQMAFSRDNVQFKIDSVVFYRVYDPLKLAYKLGTSEN